MTYYVLIEPNNSEDTEMKINGITDSVNTCDCCGRSGLARTVCFEADNGELSFIGTTCASKYAKSNGISYGLKAIEIIIMLKRNLKLLISSLKQ